MEVKCQLGCIHTYVRGTYMQFCCSVEVASSGNPKSICYLSTPNCGWWWWWCTQSSMNKTNSCVCYLNVKWQEKPMMRRDPTSVPTSIKSNDLSSLLVVRRFVSLTFLDCFYFHQTVEFNRMSQVQLTVMKKITWNDPKKMCLFLQKLLGVFGTAPGRSDKTTWMESQLLGVDCRCSQLLSTWVNLFCCDFWHSRGRKVLWPLLDHFSMWGHTFHNLNFPPC